MIENQAKMILKTIGFIATFCCVISAVLLFSQNDTVLADDRTNTSKNSTSASPKSSRTRYSSPLKSRDIDVSMYSDWPTTDLSPLCETWAHLDDFASFSTEKNDIDIQNSDLKWLFLDYLSHISPEKQSHLDSLFIDSNKSGQYDDSDVKWSFQNSVDLSIHSSKYAFEKTRSKFSINNYTVTDELEGESTQIRLLKYALSLRAHSPLCELHRKLARDAAISSGLYEMDCNVDTFAQMSANIPETFAIIYPSGKVVDTLQDLTHVITNYKNDESDSLPFQALDEILLPNEIPRSLISNANDDAETVAGINGSPTIILYTHVGTSTFSEFYKELQRLNVRFVVRHMGAIDHEEKVEFISENQLARNNSLASRRTVLQGYGIRLDIKNMEYRAYDDSHESFLNAAEDETILQKEFSLNDEYLAGININRLVTRAGIDSDDDIGSLVTLQSQLESGHKTQQKIEGLVPPTWQTRMLPLQAATTISKSQDPLRSLQDLSQNLPSRASTLANVHVSKRMTEAVNQIHDMPIMKGGDLVMGQKAPFGFFVNGKRIHVERPSFNIFELLNILRKEDIILSNLESAFNFSSPGMYKALQEAFEMGDELQQSPKQTLKASSKTHQSDQIRIDVGRGGKGAIIYINNVEKDKQYEQFLPSVSALAYGYKQIRKNLFTILIVFDPLSGDDSQALRIALYLLQQNLPVRVGILMINNDDLSSFAANGEGDWKSASLPSLADLKAKASTDSFLEIFKSGLATFGSHASLSFLFYSIERFSEMKNEGSLQDLTLHTLVSIFTQFFTSKYGVGINEVMNILQNSWTKRKNSYSESYMKAIQFASKKGIDHGMSFFNGIPLPKSGFAEKDQDDKEIIMKFQERALQVLNEETQHLTKMVVDGVISDRTTSIYGKLLSGLNLHKKFHPLLLEANNDEKTYIDNSHLKEYSNAIRTSTCNESEIYYSLDAVLDLDSPTGLVIAKKFLSIMKVLPAELSSAEECFWISYRILPNNRSMGSSFINKILRLQKVDFSLIIPSLIIFLSEEKNRTSSIVEPMEATNRFITFLREEAELHEEEKNLILHEIEADNEKTIENGKYTNLNDSVKSENFIIANGRAMKANDEIELEDVKLLMDLEKSRSKKLSDLFRPHAGQEELFSSVNQAVVYLSNLFSSKQEKRVDVISQLNVLSLVDKSEDEKFPLYFVWNEKEDSNIGGDRILKTKITVVVDPLSEPAQRAAPILIAVRDGLKLPLHLILAPRTKIDGNEGLPLTTYYRFFANYQFSSKAHSFENLPSDHVLTLRTDVPEPWNAVQTYAAQDTDNLRCDLEQACGDEAFKYDAGEYNVIDNDVTKVEYALKSLMVFGQCYDVSTGDNPNGLQLTLIEEKVTNLESLAETQMRSNEIEITGDGSSLSTSRQYPCDSDESHKPISFSDTLVMKSLGYWQLRANPGVWKLSIANDTLASEAFEIKSGELLHGAFIERDNAYGFSSSSKTVVMKDFVNRGEALFVKKTIGKDEIDLTSKESMAQESELEEDIIHVFSLATGHVYERLLKIMMLSVTKRASTTVKFWLLENFLSPGFKSTATTMAKEIGCQIEFVTYKWPEWLRGQSEKQRIIWGYKILFLDVLFPLDVKKIIYVDADQVVRADLKELRDLDLKGAPYGYTPMCSSRKSTIGFAFWRTGFWEKHLRGKPYHISALYVVDLERFRKEKVGDTLRGIYQMLSADPNSLANLDQDLPNYAQHEVKIHSLPQEWLWCESWCSDSTKAKAKTIDLCNNPLHKEPKLSMAKRVISGKLFKESWVELDEEVDSYERKFSSDEAGISV